MSAKFLLLIISFLAAETDADFGSFCEVVSWDFRAFLSRLWLLKREAPRRWERAWVRERVSEGFVGASEAFSRRSWSSFEVVYRR